MRAVGERWCTFEKMKVFLKFFSWPWGLGGEGKGGDER